MTKTRVTVIGSNGSVLWETDLTEAETSRLHNGQVRGKDRNEMSVDIVAGANLLIVQKTPDEQE